MRLKATKKIRKHWEETEANILKSKKKTVNVSQTKTICAPSKFLFTQKSDMSQTIGLYNTFQNFFTDNVLISLVGMIKMGKWINGDKKL